ncbi:plasma-membrane proton-efflux P-type ATPase [Microbulbifer thermotolerans]|uniref:plasma-membrane proton-efflux P-type ATPase n=1 Tax=Microbulbifer thermotolerans TaxID=252514 RepID=UPI002672FF80|nr:plasma-membrane proton-efflux P-type ATPase [Microbulbifer thermotolerans]WKT59988.1 plasma-membrane proton-efflux P-type ATPase [Microbulbifer thermotolerans]
MQQTSQQSSNASTATISKAGGDDLEKADLNSVYATLKTSTKGLSKTEAANRLQKYGRNAITEKEESALRKFLRFFWGPIPWMIEAAALLSALIGHWADFAIISLLLLYNAIAGFWQERKASNALAALKAGMAPKAEVLRGGEFTTIDAAEVVPGDIVRIKLGQVVPADVRFVGGDSISIDQAALTGESLPVNKKIGDLGYSGSIAKRGEMTAVVIGTGRNTFFGRTAKLVAGAGRGPSHSQKAVTQIGDFLIALCLFLALFLVGSELYRDIVIAKDWHWSDVLDILRLVLVLLIASIPVAMPSVMTVTNALGALTLSKKKAIVSRLEAIEELAGVDILCSDKTGTLTKNQLTLHDPQLFAAEDKATLIQAAALASEPDSDDPIDKAVFAGLGDKKVLDTYRADKFTPFDPVSKRTQAQVTDSSGKTLLFSKGAPQAIAALCKLSGDTADKADACVSDLAARGLRALGVARSEDQGHSWSFLGILSLEDPPRDDSRQTITRARDHGLQVKMITGDDVAIGKEIASQVGIGTNIRAAGDLFSKNQDMNHLPARVVDCVETADGFGRVFPEHKYAIVKALQGRGHQVAMTGDGVNDAPALKQADCGIAVSGATDAARAAAAIILTAPGLSTVIDAIDEARKIFERIINYVLFRVSMTLDIMVVVVFATVFFGFPPLTPIMIVLIALLDDVPIMTIAYDNTLVPSKPVHWQMRQLLLGASIIGLFSIAQSLGLLLIGMEWLGNPQWQSWIPLSKDQIQTVVFLQIVAGGHLLLFVVRARGAFFSRPWPASRLFGAIVGTQVLTVLMCGFGWLVPAIPWAIIGLVWLYMIAWMFVLDLVKRILYRHQQKSTYARGEKS